MLTAGLCSQLFGNCFGNNLVTDLLYSDSVKLSPFSSSPPLSLCLSLPHSLRVYRFFDNEVIDCFCVSVFSSYACQLPKFMIFFLTNLHFISLFSNSP